MHRPPACPQPVGVPLLLGRVTSRTRVLPAAALPALPSSRRGVGPRRALLTGTLRKGLRGFREDLLPAGSALEARPGLGEAWASPSLLSPGPRLVPLADPFRETQDKSP